MIICYKGIKKLTAAKDLLRFYRNGVSILSLCVFFIDVEGVGKDVYHRVFCNNISHPLFLLMLNWLLKDALLACKRCPFEVLLTPF